MCDAPIVGGPVNNPSTHRIYVLGRLAPKSWYRTGTNYPWTPSYSALLPYIPSPGLIHSYLNLNYEKKMNNYSEYHYLGGDLPHLASPKHTKFIIIILCNCEYQF